MHIQPVAKVDGRVIVPSDKSITHRGILFGALAKGTTVVRSPLDAADTRSTAACAQRLGAEVDWRQGDIHIVGAGLVEPGDVLDCGNSGTSIRLLMGALAGRDGFYVLSGDSSLRRRPMARVSKPLRAMGACINGRGDGAFAPLALCGGRLEGGDMTLPVASAQVKSALLLAGLRAHGRTRVIEPRASRDHTERLLPLFGVQLQRSGLVCSIEGGQALHAAELDVPADPSSAAFFLALAAILPGSRVTVSNVCLNPTRVGFLDVLRRYGAHVDVEVTGEFPEPVGTVTVSAFCRRAVTVEAAEVPSMIDELPLVAVLGAFAEDGLTVVRGAQELRVKESDRIATIAEGLAAMGARIETREDGFIVAPGQLCGARVESHGDHRMAMALTVAACAARGASELIGEEAVAISYPTFFETLTQLS